MVHFLLVGWILFGCGSSSPRKRSGSGGLGNEKVTGHPGTTSHEVVVGLAGQKAHRFFLRTVNPAESGVQILDLNEVIGPRAIHPRSLMLAFAAWYCEPCKYELAAFVERSEEFSKVGSTIGIVVIDEGDEDRRRMVNYLVEELNMKFPVVEDSFQLIARRYGVKSLPHTALVDAMGTIQKVHRGYVGTESVDELIRDLSLMIELSNRN